ncbi:MAG: TIGR03936 family radical SAM-associated protein [Acidimicrobiales bacterium]
MRLRARFTKQGKVGWTSHRDVARMWERGLRRARLPVAYTEGFSPRPRLSFGLALPTGHTSWAEYLDIDLVVNEVRDIDLVVNEVRNIHAPVDATVASVSDVAGQVFAGHRVGELAGVLTEVLPNGVDVLGCALIGSRQGSLQHEVTSCTWLIEVLGVSPAMVSDLARSGMEAETMLVTRERKGREATDDLRPAIRGLAASGASPGGSLLLAELATAERGVRPTELLQGLGAAASLVLEPGQICRTHQWIERDGQRWEPIPLPPMDARCASGRAQ